MSLRELDPQGLRRICDPAALGFATTAEVAPRDTAIAQERARRALSFGLGVQAPGYNIFATGPIGTGKRAALEHELGDSARGRPDPLDVVYLHNFADSRRPLARTLPAGRGPEFAAAMTDFVGDARRELARAFESEAHQGRRRELAGAMESARDTALDALREKARTLDIALELTPAGVLTIPLVDGEPITRDDFGDLPEAAKKSYQARMKQLEPEVREFLIRMRSLEREARAKLHALDRDAGLFAVGHLLDDLKRDFADAPALADWLDAVRDHMLEHLEELGGQESEDEDLQSTVRNVLGAGSPDAGSHYEVNVFVTHEPGQGAPVVVETSPTYLNLFGRIEHRGVFGGGFVTDHRNLRPGALHEANGGYLMLPARDVLAQPLLWQRLKDVLQSRRIRLENLGDQYALLPTPSLLPDPIDVNVKTVLYGPPPLYELAWMYDDDVRKLFRVKVEFESRVPWNDAHVADYAGFLAAEAQRAGLRPLDAGAVARIVEEGARIAGHREWLTTRSLDVAALATEASRCAELDDAVTVEARHVDRAIATRRDRSDLLEQRLIDAVSDETLMIDVDSAQIGQMNGLAVIDMGGYAFGHPVRITATTGLGKGDLVSIEREVDLSGRIHDKGFLALRGFLEDRYGGSRRLALAAHLTFEQSYEEIEGDSAAAAELYALLSSISGIPMRQDVAVTGSVNQHGQIQAIGGVNEKIEGFFRVCRAKGGLTGRQGVLVPGANVQHLMLSPEVVDAVRAGEFHVWAAANVDEGLELLTGMSAVDFHAHVRKRLAKLASAASGRSGAGPQARSRPVTGASGR